MSGSQTISNSATRIEAFQVQSSAYGVTIPLVYGVQRIGGNLVWYGGFKAVPHTTESGGKGGGVKVQNTTFTYQASVMMGLCHGRISGIPRIWRGKKLYSGGLSPTQLLSATETYTPPGSGAMTYTVAQAATFKSISIITAPFVTTEPWNRTLQRFVDYTAVAGVVTILDDRWRGVLLTIRYQYSTGSISQNALDQLGLTFIPGELGQAAWSGLASFGSQSIGYSGLALLAGQNYDLGTGAQVENHTVEVIGPMAYTTSDLSGPLADVDPSLVLRDILSNATAGANFPGDQLDDWAAWSDFCVASSILCSVALTEQVAAADVIDMAGKLTNTMPVFSGGRLKMVPRSDVSVTGNGRTYTPSVTPVYALDDECYFKRDGDPPMYVERKSPADRCNHVRVEYCDRALDYAPAIAEAKDQADIDATGLRTMPTIDAKSWICDATYARHIAQHLLQRSLFVEATYHWQLPWHYALLEPADIVTLTDAGLELAAAGACILTIAEDEDGELTFTGEDYLAGTGEAPLYPAQAPAGYLLDWNVAPGNADTPIIFEAPVERTVNGLALYIAVKGSGANWGGAQVWVSLDGTNYKRMGVVYGSARAGTLSAAVTSGATSLGVQGLGSQQLISGSAADAAALSTLCYVGGANPEYFSYQTATLTGAGAYTLASLVRGAYRSAAAAHSSGDVFVRVDSRVIKSEDLDITMIARQVWVKVCSFNIYGGGQQSLADVSATTYTITGVMAKIPPGDVAGLTATAAKGAVRISWTGNKEKDYAATELRLGSTWASSSALRDIKADYYDWPWPAAGSYTILARHRDRTGNLSTATASVGVTVTATGIAITGNDLSVALGGGNLLPNSSFEADSNADGVPDSWTNSSFGTGLTVTRSLVTGGAPHGTKSLRLTVSAITAPTSQATHQVVQTLAESSPVLEGQNYVLSIAARTSTLTYTGIVQVQWLDAADATVSTDTVANSYAFAAANAWERIAGLAMTAPATAVKARVRFGIRRPSTSSTVTGTMDFDAVLLQLGDYPTQYAPMGEEILPGSVGTTQLALASATDTLVAKSAFTAATLAGGAPGDVTVTACTLSYVNDTDATISVQVEASFFDAYLTNPGAITTKQIYLQETGAVEGNESPLVEQFNVPPATGNYPGFARAWQWTLAAGATLTCAVKVRVAGSSTSCAVNVDEVVLRLTAIKR